mgnify:CR=1 FL=1
MPWRMIAKVGFPVVAAMYLLGILSGAVGSPLLHVQTVLNRHVETDQTVILLLRQICRNKSSEFTQANCEAH